MSKKTLLLILSLLAVTVILLIVALSPTTLTKRPEGIPFVSKPTPNMSFTSLALSPNPVILSASGSGEVDVIIDTGQNKVSGVQIEMSYDPKALTNVSIIKGPLFAKGITFIPNPVNPLTGRIKYLMGISYGTNPQPIQGSGVVAQIFFTKNPTAPASMTTTTLTFLDATKVTELGVSATVLKTKSSATVDFTSPGRLQPTGSSALFPTTSSSTSGR